MPKSALEAQDHNGPVQLDKVHPAGDSHPAVLGGISEHGPDLVPARRQEALDGLGLERESGSWKVWDV